MVLTREWPLETAWLRLVNRKNRVEILAGTDGQHGGLQAARPALAASGVGSTRFTDFSYRAL